MKIILHYNTNRTIRPKRFDISCEIHTKSSVTALNTTLSKKETLYFVNLNFNVYSSFVKSPQYACILACLYPAQEFRASVARINDLLAAFRFLRQPTVAVDHLRAY